MDVEGRRLRQALSEQSYESLIAEAVSKPLRGWDFGLLRDRAPITHALPWNYAALSAETAAGKARMLDMGTGGGEALSALATRAAFTVANEGWPPNVPVAATNLRPLGIPVIHDEGAPDNMDEAGDPVRGRLPYRDGAFDVVLNQHESFRASEVRRILRVDGAFITQQVDYRNYDDLYAAVDLEPPPEPETWLPLAVEQIEAAGLEVTHAERGEETRSFHDVGAFAWYVLAISWSIPEFDLERCDAALRRLHETMQVAPLPVRERRFLVVSRRR